MFEDMCRDMNKLCATMTDRPVYGIGLGDLIHEDANMWEIYRSGVKTLSFPMFGVIGNHDHDTKAPTDGEAIRRILVPRTIRSIWAGSISSVWTTSS